MKGRYIGENTRFTYDLMDYTDNEYIPGLDLLVLLDFEKKPLILYHGYLYTKCYNFSVLGTLLLIGLRF